MKPVVLRRVVLLLMLGPVSCLNAQHRAVYFKLTSIETDTVRKQIVFRYRLGNIAPKDSLSIDLLDSAKAPFRLKAVYGDVGTVLTDGKKKVIYWNPVVDRQKLENTSVGIRFIVKTTPDQGLTRWQTITLGRWVVSGGLTAYTLWEGVGIVNAARKYNNEEQPTSQGEKDRADAEQADIQVRQRNFYRIAAISATTLLANITLSLMQSRYKLKPAKLRVTGSTDSIGLAYKL